MAVLYYKMIMHKHCHRFNYACIFGIFSMLYSRGTSINTIIVINMTVLISTSIVLQCAHC